MKAAPSALGEAVGPAPQPDRRHGTRWPSLSCTSTHPPLRAEPLTIVAELPLSLARLPVPPVRMTGSEEASGAEEPGLEEVRRRCLLRAIKFGAQPPGGDADSAPIGIKPFKPFRMAALVVHQGTMCAPLGPSNPCHNYVNHVLGP